MNGIIYIYRVLSSHTEKLYQKQTREDFLNNHTDIYTVCTMATTVQNNYTVPASTKEDEVAALNTLAKCIEYENRAYTETRKVEVYNADGSFKEYHASNTTTNAREIDMTTHFTVHPDKTDAGQVSLTAD